jgi:hypothetical protein
MADGEIKPSGNGDKYRGYAEGAVDHQIKRPLSPDERERRVQETTQALRDLSDATGVFPPPGWQEGEDGK